MATMTVVRSPGLGRHVDGRHAEGGGPVDGGGHVDDFLDPLRLGRRRLTERTLDLVAKSVAAAPELWADPVTSEEPTVRLRTRLARSDNLEVLLLVWPRDEPSDWHDHGGSSGGYAVVRGRLVERYRGADGVRVLERRMAPGNHRGFGASHLHDMVSTAAEPAVSVHAYSPPIETMTYYTRTPLGFVARGVVPER